MSEIRDRVREKMAEYLYNYGKGFSTFGSLFPKWEAQTEHLKELYRKNADQILSIPELAVVDREAELPKNPTEDTRGKRRYTCHTEEIEDAQHDAYAEAQQDMLKAGYIKEVKD